MTMTDDKIEKLIEKKVSENLDRFTRVIMVATERNAEAHKKTMEMLRKVEAMAKAFGDDEPAGPRLQ
jgi:hypothetical protein